MNIRCKSKLIDLSSPKIMGILNITPDSFYDGGKYTNEQTIKQRVKQMLDEGATFIDIGAYSSRPYAQQISISEEKRRLDLALEVVRSNFKEAIISVDTFRSEIAEYVIEHYEVDIINDITASTADNKMLEVVRYYQVPYIMMHMQGTPQTMQINPKYDNIVKDIIYFFSERLNKAALIGINDVIIDPGFGFGKTIDHNYELLANLDAFKILEKPILVGISRKSMIYKLLNSTPEDSLAGTIAVNVLALIKGANILRVHDVKQAADSIAIVEKFKQMEKQDY